MVYSPLYYRMVMASLKPLYWLKLNFFSRKKTKNNELAQRFGREYPKITTQKPILWCHAVSLGEINTAKPFLKGLLDDGYALWITNTTHTGFNQTEQLFKKEIEEGDVYHSFIPVDDSKIIRQFLEHVKPKAALFVETELWATTLAILAQKYIPSILINGRLSKKSFQGYQKIYKVSKSMMVNLSLIIAQDGESAKRFRQLGATSDKIRLASSLKWSSQTNPIMLAKAEKIRQQWQLNGRTILVAGSTHEGEEQLILQNFQQLQKQFPDKKMLLIIVPRHPERFDDVAKLIENQEINFVRRSQQQEPNDSTTVYLADSMGELGIWYALSDLAFVGGSLVDIGGHNPIEAAIVGKPIVMGQYTQSCQQIVNQLKEVNALKQVQTNDELFTVFKQWLNQPEQAKLAGFAGQNLAESYQNATQQQINMVTETLERYAEKMKKNEHYFTTRE